jgi:hypothetical protein
MTDAASLPLPNGDAHENEETTADATAGDREPITWVTVGRYPGLMQAQIVAGRLRAEGIPARAWQEGAGSALGLTVGILGTGHVDVPEEYANEAEQVLETEYEETDDGEMNGDGGDGADAG